MCYESFEIEERLELDFLSFRSKFQVIYFKN